MFVFRTIELFNLQYIFGEGVLSFVFVNILTIIGVIVLIYMYRIIMNFLKKRIKLVGIK